MDPCKVWAPSIVKRPLKIGLEGPFDTSILFLGRTLGSTEGGLLCKSSRVCKYVCMHACMWRNRDFDVFLHACMHVVEE